MNGSECSVAKFGGTSLADAKAMLRSARIVKNDPSIRVVVVSATSGTTNKIVNLCSNSRGERDPKITTELIEKLSEDHNQIAKDLKANEETIAGIESLIESLRAQICELQNSDPKEKTKIIDSVLSHGERLSSLLFAEALRHEGRESEVVPSTELVITNGSFGKAEPDVLATRAACKANLEPKISLQLVLITQGFIGASDSGEVTTLGRGGSDYSAALIAEAIGAREVQIWTDVPGIYTCDPRVVPNATSLPEITFDEAAELANFGAKVLHPATLWPAVRSDIGVYVGSTIHPELGGTMIAKEVESKPAVRAIAVRRQQTLLTVTSLKMLNSHGFLAKIFSILAEHEISVDLVTTSEVSVALTIDGRNAGSGEKSWLLTEDILGQLNEFSEVKVERDLTLIGIIGNDLSNTSGLGANAFSSVSDYNIRLICHGASSHNFCFLVSESDAPDVVRRLHDRFLSNDSKVQISKSTTTQTAQSA